MYRRRVYASRASRARRIQATSRRCAIPWSSSPPSCGILYRRCQLSCASLHCQRRSSIPDNELPARTYVRRAMRLLYSQPASSAAHLEPGPAKWHSAHAAAMHCDGRTAAPGPLSPPQPENHRTVTAPCKNSFCRRTGCKVQPAAQYNGQLDLRFAASSTQAITLRKETVYVRHPVPTAAPVTSRRRLRENQSR